MRTIAEQKQDYSALLNQAEAILDTADAADRALTAAEQSKYDSLVGQLTQMKADIERQQGAQRPTFLGQPSNALDDSEIIALGSTRSRIAMPAHAGKLIAFKNTARGREDAHTAGRFLAATFLRHGPSMRWCEQHGVRFDPMAALSGGVNTSGGALVPDEMSRTIIELVEKYGAFRQNADNLPMTSDTLTVPRRTGGLEAFYVGENTEGTESNASWDNVQFVAKKMMVLTRMSSEVSEDAIINLGDKMAHEISLAFALKEDTVGFTGTGISTDGGHVGVLVAAIDGTHTLAAVTASGAANSCDVLSEITADHLLDLMAAVPLYAKAGAKWYCSPTAMSLVFDAIKIAGGGNSLENLANAVEPRFLGYPIVQTPVMVDSPTTDCSGAVMLAFGNLQMAATIATRRDIRVQMSDQRYWAEDQIGIKGTLRHSIVAHDLGSASVKSPFCVLVGN